MCDVDAVIIIDIVVLLSLKTVDNAQKLNFFRDKNYKNK